MGGSAVGLGALAGAAAGAVSAAVNGGNILKSALTGAITGAAFAHIGGLDIGDWTRTAYHALAGGVSSVIQGGKFGRGFLSAGFAKFATLKLAAAGVFKMENKDFGSVMKRTTAAAIVGGTASKLGGGKFANGAQTAAMAHLLNAELGGRKDAQKEVNSCSGKLTCEAVDFSGEGRGETQTTFGKEIVKWGRYDCTCSNSHEDFNFVAPGDDFDNLKGVVEQHTPFKQYKNEFTVDPSNDSFFNRGNKTFIESFKNNRQSIPDKLRYKP